MPILISTPGWVLPVFHLTKSTSALTASGSAAEMLWEIGTMFPVCLLSPENTECASEITGGSTPGAIYRHPKWPQPSREVLRKTGACWLLLAILRSSWARGVSFNPRKALPSVVASLLGYIRCCETQHCKQCGHCLEPGSSSLPSHHLETEGKVKSSIIFLYSPLVYHCLIVSLNLIKFWGKSLPQ